MSYFDLRLPLGWLFVILGLLIVCAGFGAQVTSEGMSLGWNVDFLWGAVMIGFGVICLWFARREAKEGGPSNLANAGRDGSEVTVDILVQVERSGVRGDGE